LHIATQETSASGNPHHHGEHEINDLNDHDGIVEVKAKARTTTHY